AHFWLHVGGLLLYVISMWIAGVTEGTMWRATNADGSLTYSFIASLEAIKPLYLARFMGGLMIVAGMIVMAWNLWHTAADARAHLIVPVPIPVPEPVALQVPKPLPASA